MAIVQYYTQQQRFYCGLCLRARSFLVCLVNTFITFVKQVRLADAHEDSLNTIAPFFDHLA